MQKGGIKGWVSRALIAVVTVAPACDALSELPHLHTVLLDLRGCGVGDAGVTALAHRARPTGPGNAGLAGSMAAWTMLSGQFYESNEGHFASMKSAIVQLEF